MKNRAYVCINNTKGLSAKSGSPRTGMQKYEKLTSQRWHCALRLLGGILAVHAHTYIHARLQFLNALGILMVWHVRVHIYKRLYTSALLRTLALCHHVYTYVNTYVHTYQVAIRRALKSSGSRSGMHMCMYIDK
jgi:hypothetical protein